MAENKTQSDDGKLTPIRAGVIIILALIIDGIQWFLDLILIGIVLNYIVDVYAWLTFYVLFKRWGYSMWGAKKGERVLLSLAGSLGLEVVSLGALPAWTAWAIYTVFSEFAKNTAEKIPGVSKALGA